MTFFSHRILGICPWEDLVTEFLGLIKNTIQQLDDCFCNKIIKFLQYILRWFLDRSFNCIKFLPLDDLFSNRILVTSP